MQQAADEAAEQLRKNELLILSASTGFKADVETLIADGADVNCSDKEGTPLLHFPAAKGKLEIVKLLLSKGVEVDAEDGTGQTALHFASQENAYEVVKVLIKSRAWLDAYDTNEDTALHLAIREDHMETVKHLLMGGAKTEIANTRNLTALGEATVAKNTEMLQLLLNKGADVTHVSKGFSLLHLASATGCESVLQVLLKHLSLEKIVHPGGVTPLHCATLKSVPDSIVRLLVSHGCDPHTPDSNGRVPLDWAKDEGNDNEEVLKLLSIGERKKRSQRRHRTTSVTEIEPADGPDGEWNSFQRMSYSEKLKQVEVWARSKDEYLNDLIFLDNDSRKAVALVGNFMRMLECRLAVERLKSDVTFQVDAVDPFVQNAIAECTETPQSIRKFAGNEKVMGVLVKLKRLQEILKRNGRMKIVYEDLLNTSESTATEGKADSTTDEHNLSTEDLEKALKTAKEAVVKAVLGGSAATKKQEEGTMWWNTDSTTTGDASGEYLKLGSGAFFKSMIYQFLRQFLYAVLMFAVMVLGMYLTDSLPTQGSRVTTPSVAPSSAFVTENRDVHAQLNERNFNPEL